MFAISTAKYRSNSASDWEKMGKVQVVLHNPMWRSIVDQEACQILVKYTMPSHVREMLQL